MISQQYQRIFWSYKTSFKKGLVTQEGENILFEFEKKLMAVKEFLLRYLTNKLLPIHCNNCCFIF